MPDIPVGAQIFDVVFHPNQSTVYTGLLNGEIKAFSYDDQGHHESLFTTRPTKRSCRGLAISGDGRHLWAVGKRKILHTLDTSSGKIAETRADAHDSSINRVTRLWPHMLATADDDGVIKLWDPRKPDSIRTYAHHFDYISDFLWLEDKKQLVATSGDGTLSVLDVRANKTQPFAQSEDQEDELLSIASIRNGSKIVVGTQSGILSIFNRKSGWGDCVDRIPGHPHSVDALCNLPSSYPSAHSTILTGSSDGLVRAVQLFPTKLLGVVVDHGECPVERIKVDRNGEGRWVGSAGHEEVLKLTDLRDIFEDERSEDERSENEDQAGSSGNEDGDEDDEKEVQEVDENSDEEQEGVEVQDQEEPGKEVADDEEEPEEGDGDGVDEKGQASEDDSDVPLQKKRKRKEKDPLVAGKRKKGKNEVVGDASFFSGL